MRSLHRSKAIAAYNCARTAIKNNESYPAYILLKEAARGALSFIIEDAFDEEISDKTKIRKLIDWADDVVLTDEDRETLNILDTAERGGLQALLSMDINDLKKIKRVVKGLIANYLKEPV